MDWWNHRTVRVWIALLLAILMQGPPAGRTEQNIRRIRVVVNGLKKQLGIKEEIRTAVVERNNLVVSVSPVDDQKRIFEISFEKGFLDMLDEEDLYAVVAHEMGHIWIYTHHPFLQTEDLANDIAYKAVSIDAMDRIYEKLRARQAIISPLEASMRD
jgi:hypothetical protein